jgi:hypothetical protein
MAYESCRFAVRPERLGNCLNGYGPNVAYVIFDSGFRYSLGFLGCGKRIKFRAAVTFNLGISVTLQCSPGGRISPGMLNSSFWIDSFQMTHID